MEAESSWLHRYLPWIDYYHAFPLQREATFMLDDSSPYAANDNRVAIQQGALTPPQPGTIQLYRFAEHLGNKRHIGWWRSFLFSLRIARAYGLRKIIHIESDAYILSGHLVDYLEGLQSGWTVLWCPLYQMPEAGIQVIVEDQFTAMQRFAEMDVSEVSRTLAEQSLPFTCVEKGFYGDRYGEIRRRIPRTADYACQVNAFKMTPTYRGST
jgi:hypothetical protein